MKVRLFRPWSASDLVAALPATATKICVLDRTKESGAFADPLYLEVASTLAEHEVETGWVAVKTWCSFGSSEEFVQLVQPCHLMPLTVLTHHHHNPNHPHTSAHPSLPAPVSSWLFCQEACGSTLF